MVSMFFLIAILSKGSAKTPNVTMISLMRTRPGPRNVVEMFMSTPTIN